MTEPLPETLRAQLKELNERSRTYARQFWQVPFAYVAASAVALSQVIEKPVALKAALLTIGGIGAFTAWHLAGLYEASRSCFCAMKRTETSLGLPTEDTRWMPHQLRALLALTAVASLAALIAGIYLLKCG